MDTRVKVNVQKTQARPDLDNKVPMATHLSHMRF